MIASGRVAGVILFADNAPDRGTARRSLRALQGIESPPGLQAPLLAMVDQEGGQVKRIAGPPTASAEKMGMRGEAFAATQGLATGRSLSRLGFNIDLAPVLDLDLPGGAIGREQRSFGADPERVSAVAIDGFGAGLDRSGVVATAKHFPGIGSIETNTDNAAQAVRLGPSELQDGPIRPFEDFIAARGRMIMVGLATYPEIANRPAALSAKFVTDELRGRLGFSGVTITDGLGAAAAVDFGDTRKVALAAVNAGNDLLLYSDWRAARDVGRLFAGRLRSGALERASFEDSAERVLDLRGSLAERSG